MQSEVLDRMDVPAVLPFEQPFEQPSELPSALPLKNAKKMPVWLSHFYRPSRPGKARMQNPVHEKIAENFPPS
jgi:hypothetical protein